MGLFDYRCVVTDLPLNGRRAVFVAVIETEPGKWAPISLPVAGQYDREGTIDGMSPDFRLATLAQGFEEAARAGRVTAADEVASELTRARPLSPTSVMLVIERATTMAPHRKEPGLKVDGRAVRHVLFLEEVYDAIVGEAGALPKTDPFGAVVQVRVRDCFEDAFGEWLHRDLHKTLGPTRRKVLAALQELIAVRAWLDAHKISWTNGEIGQYFYPDDFAANLAARKRFADVPEFSRILQSHARKVEAVAEEEAQRGDEEARKLPPRWMRDAGVSWFGLRTGAGAFAATKPEKLREVLTQQLTNPAALTELAEVIVVQEGLTAQRVDLRPLLKAAIPDGASSEAANKALVVVWDEVAQRLPKLVAPKANTPVLTFAEPRPPPVGGYALHRFELVR